MTITNTTNAMSRFTLRNQFFGLVLLAIAILAVACNGQYFRATEHYSGQIEEALESIKAPAFYNVFVKNGRVPFLLILQKHQFLQ